MIERTMSEASSSLGLLSDRVKRQSKATEPNTTSLIVLLGICFSDK